MSKLHESINNKLFENIDLLSSLSILLEEMSEEDRHDTDLIKSIMSKIQTRSNAKLTPEEQDVLKKYNLQRGSHDLYATSSKHPGSAYTRLQLPTRTEIDRKRRYRYPYPKVHPYDEINFADMARKRGERLDRDTYELGKNSWPVVVDNTNNHSSWDRESRLDKERNALNAYMQNDYYNLSQALKDRKYHEKQAAGIDSEAERKRKELDDKYLKDIEAIERNRLSDKSYHGKRISSQQDYIDDLLDKHRNNKK